MDEIKTKSQRENSKHEKIENGARKESSNSIPYAKPVRCKKTSYDECERYYKETKEITRRFNRYNDLEIFLDSCRSNNPEDLMKKVNMEFETWLKRNSSMGLDPFILKNACFWITIPTEMAFFLAYIIREGYQVHHATPFAFTLVKKTNEPLQQEDIVLQIKKIEPPNRHERKSPTAMEVDENSFCREQPSSTEPLPTQSSSTELLSIQSSSTESLSTQSSSTEPPSIQSVVELPIPEYGTHYCRIECLIVHRTVDKNTSGLFVLLVREKFGKLYREDRLGTLYAQTWKLVSGTVKCGEFLTDAGYREITEEVNLPCLLACVVGFSNRLNARFARDEITICCLFYTDLPPNFLPLITPNEEIESACWVPIEMAHVTLATLNDAYNQEVFSWINAAKKMIFSGEMMATTSMREKKLYDPKTGRQVRNYDSF